MCNYTPSSPCDFAPGDLIDGKYTVDRMLGEGSFGRVYKVRIGQNFYALKLFKFWELMNSYKLPMMKRFDREYEIGKIKSNFLVHNLDRGTVNGNPYLIMEYFPNGDLESYSSRNNNIDHHRIAANILYGLRDLHINGKIHRDLKPANVLIREDGTAVLTDFGIAGDPLNRMSQRGTSQGTYLYMPPEIFYLPRYKLASVIPTVDIYAFGVLMYELIVGSFPFGQCNSLSEVPLYYEIAKTGSWRKSDLQCIAPEWLPLIDGCLKPKSDARLQSIDAVLQLLPNTNLQRQQPQPTPARPSLNNAINGIKLRIMQGEDYGVVYNIANVVNGQPRILTVGRKDSDVLNHIPITENDSSYISRCHCTIEYDIDKKKWLIRDGQYRMECNIAKRCFKEPFPCKQCTAACPVNRRGTWKRSLNGTYVNSTEVDENGCFFKPGDIISIGDVTLRVEGY